VLFFFYNKTRECPKISSKAFGDPFALLKITFLFFVLTLTGPAFAGREEFLSRE
jgi:hypothetical protein